VQVTLQHVAICVYTASSFIGIWFLRVVELLPGTVPPPQLQVKPTKLVWMGPENYMSVCVTNIILDALL